jgi:hypothetical protein
MTHPYKNNPTYKFDLSIMSDFTDILREMKRLQIVSYVYTFVCDRGVIKYGYSCDHSHSYGERIYRQAGHLSGWNRKLNGSSGSDMRVIADEYKEKYNETLNKNNIVIYVTDMSRLPDPDCYNVEFHCKELERTLINECIDYNGRPPIGNRDSASLYYQRAVNQTKAFNAVFEIEE